MALHTRDDIDILYISRKERGGFASFENCRDASVQELEEYIKNNNIQYELWQRKNKE